jgi:hypothetical protein
MYSRFSIQTRLSTIEAEETLARLIASRRPDASPTKPFVGRIESGTFKFHRVFIGRNSFIPIISGRIVEGEGGAVVQGAMRLHWAIAVCMTVWMSMAIVAVVATLRKGTLHSDTFAVLSAVFFPLFGIVVMSIGYFPERRKAMRLLEDAFRVGWTFRR